LAEPQAFSHRLAKLRRLDWVVYAKPPFGGRQQVLAYLGRYTHRVAIANSGLISLSDGTVRFTWKDYRHHGKNKVMTLAAGEFIRRFHLHTLPDGFHRSRHYGFLANGERRARLALCRRLLDARGTMRPPHRLPIMPAAILGSPHSTSRSVPIAAASCAASQSCRVPPSRSSATRHDSPTDVHHDRSPRTADGGAAHGRTTQAAVPMHLAQSLLPLVAIPSAAAIAAHTPGTPLPAASTRPAAHAHRPSQHSNRRQPIVTIPIVPNIPRLRSIRLP
jgi:hypothetical protein